MSLLTGSETSIRVHERHVIHSLPILVLMVHSRCNCRCIMCDIWKVVETRELQLQDLAPHIDSIGELGVEWVIFSGGEPLMNPGLFGLAAALHNLNIRLTLLTTGLLLKKYASECATHFDEIIVSLDGPEPIHDSIRRIPRAFALMSEGIEAVKAANSCALIRARSTVQSANHAHLSATVDAAKDLDLDSISFLAADVTSTAFNRELLWPLQRQNDISLTENDICRLQEEIDRLTITHADDFASGFIVESPSKLRQIAGHFRAQLGLEPAVAPTCNAPWVSTVVEVDGTVRPCFFHHGIGNLKDAPLSELLNSHRALEFRRSLSIKTNSICRSCVCSLNYKSQGGANAAGV